MVFVTGLPPAAAVERLGTGNASLLGGDLTDPDDKVVDRGATPRTCRKTSSSRQNATWLRMYMRAGERPADERAPAPRLPELAGRSGLRDLPEQAPGAAVVH